MNPTLWQPNQRQIAYANLTRFTKTLPISCDPSTVDGYRQLHHWSFQHSGEFWRAVWDFCEVLGTAGGDDVDGRGMMDHQWFPSAKLNFTENVLGSAERLLKQSHWPAIIHRNENFDRSAMSFGELHHQVICLARWLQAQDVKAGDRVAAVLPNIPEAIVAFLAVAAIGAVWSACSPDFGDDAIVDRFGQIGPKILFTSITSSYFGKTTKLLAKVRRIEFRVPSLKGVVVIGGYETSDFQDYSTSYDLPNSKFIAFEPIISQPVDKLGTLFEFEQFPFNHPLAILYSSGTTGMPKCIIHGSGGTLLQHKKEHVLHCDIKPVDRVFYYTTTGWMMWNWLVSALASQATIVLYDGSPLHPNTEVLLQYAAEASVTHFGASAKYYAALEKSGVTATGRRDLSALRVVMSTGSPLLPESFDYIYRDVKEDVLLASISGGTDIISCFALGCPTLPVRRGELQVKGLGMDVKVFNDAGEAIVGEPGELVCTSPFPSMPVAFWNDPDGAKYRAAYFERFDHTWCHGDWAEETPCGGLNIHGRSDATLNPGGVRIGTAELYSQVEAFPQVAEALATAFRRDGDEKIVLFLKMKPDEVMTAELVTAIKQRLRTNCSPRHVPSHVILAGDFPRTISGKLSEIAVRNAINGLPIRNLAALANPECIAFFQTLGEFQPAAPRS